MQFLTWFAEVEEGMGEQQDIEFRDYVGQLNNHRNECTAFLAKLDQGLNNLHHLSSQVRFFLVMS